MVFLLVILVPLFAARWRVSVVGLGLQGLLLWAAAGGHESLFQTADLLVLRGLLVPALLWRCYRGRARNDVIPANLFAWGFVAAVTLAAFWFADALAAGSPHEGRIAVASAAFLLGLFVLASQDSPFSQLVGVLRIENAVAMFELTLPGHHVDPVVRTVQLAVTAGIAILAAWFLRQVGPPAPPEAAR